MNWLDVILKFDGIIGAVAGVVATLITTEIIKSFGRIKFYFYDCIFEYSGVNKEHGFEMLVEDAKEADSCDYKIRMQLYNSSESIKVLKDFQIEFVLENRNVYNKPHNEDEFVKRAGFVEYTDFNLVNVPPKKMIEIKLTGSVSNEDMVEFSNMKSIYLCANNHNNKKVKQLIKKF